MSRLSVTVAAAFACGVLAAPEAFAQRGGGGASGPPAGGGAGQVTRDMDRDQIKSPTMDKDQIRDKTKDQDRDQDRLRDPVYLGAQDQLRSHDQDRDGRLSRDEFNRWNDDAFGLMDADHSNGLSLQEFLAARLGPGPASGSAKQRQQMQELVQARKTERFRLMDGDGNGVLTHAEYMKFGELNYLDADTNDDGKLTFKEMQQFHRGM
jgi:hypothetical protein